jgi:hypothetical protein
MYVVKVLHGYITPTGCRTRLKSEARLFKCKDDAEKFASKIGGRVKRIK